MYDDFSADYDRFVDWPARLAAELPFVGRELQAAGAHRVLDAACGTGMHSIALAQRGYTVVGADLSAGMIEQARTNADGAGVSVQFEMAGFGELAQTFGAPRPEEPELGNLTSASSPRAASSGRRGVTFDALLCLGNSLPHLLTPADLAAALADFAACLPPGGLLLVQNRNFDAVLAQGERWMEPQSYRDEAAEWLFLRFYDFEPDGTLTFNLATLRREGTRNWSQHVSSTRLRPLRQMELIAALSEAGFDNVVCYGDMTGAPFDPRVSPNLVITARRHISRLTLDVSEGEK